MKDSPILKGGCSGKDVEFMKGEHEATLRTSWGLGSDCI